VRHTCPRVKKYHYLSVVLFLLLWVLGVNLYLPAVQKDLAEAARKTISGKQYGGVFNEVSVSFSGQEAVLSGKVATAEQSAEVEKIVREQVRLPDQQPTRNPVIAVHNNIEVNPELAHAPWLIATSFGESRRVDGYLKSADQSLQLFSSLGGNLPGAKLNRQAIVDEKSLPVKDWQKTIATLPDFAKLLEGKKDKEASLVAATNCDGEWKVFPPEVTDDEVAEYLQASRVTAKQVSMALNDLRTMPSAEEVARKKAEELKKAEAVRQQLEKAMAESKAKAEADAKAKAEQAVPAAPATEGGKSDVKDSADAKDAAPK